jgi:hypothetical protein
VALECGHVGAEQEQLVVVDLAEVASERVARERVVDPPVHEVLALEHVDQLAGQRRSRGSTGAGRRAPASGGALFEASPSELVQGSSFRLGRALEAADLHAIEPACPG